MYGRAPYSSPASTIACRAPGVATQRPRGKSGSGDGRLGSLNVVMGCSGWGQKQISPGSSPGLLIDSLAAAASLAADVDQPLRPVRHFQLPHVVELLPDHLLIDGVRVG